MALRSGAIPEFKKKVASFLAKEDGKISKESLIKAGIMASIFSLGAAMSAKSAASHRSCDRECPDILSSTRPEEVEWVSNKTGNHTNNIDLSESDNLVTAQHSHCVENCHASHSSHGSHGSHCAWMC